MKQTFFIDSLFQYSLSFFLDQPESLFASLFNFKLIQNAQRKSATNFSKEF